MLAAFLALSGAASAQALHLLAPTGAIWKTKPTGSDMARFYPDRAARAGLSGWAVIECLTETTGDLKDCQVLGEAPLKQDFGAAALKLSRLFKVDTAKITPEMLNGGVVAFPIVLTMDKAPPPLFNHRAGDPAVLLTPSTNGVTPCPTPAAPKQLCTPHRFTWAAAPMLVESAPFVRAAAASPASTALICPIGADMKLEHCMQAGPADPSQLEAMKGLLPLLTAPTQGEDNAPAKDGFVAIQFDWPALKHAVETSVLTRQN